MPHSRQRRVGPSEKNIEREEIRPSRFIRIHHINDRPRDKKFQQEMLTYIQYKNKGIHASGPLTMQKVKRQQNNIQHRTTSPVQKEQLHPNSVFEPEVLTLSENSNRVNNVATEAAESDQNILDSITTKESENQANSSLPNSLFSSPSHASEKVRSASSVQLAMHNQKQQQEQHEQYKTLLRQAHANIPHNISEMENDNDSKLHLDLSQVNETSNANKNNGDNDKKICRSPLSPPTMETKTNDASFCPDLFTMSPNSSAVQPSNCDKPSHSDQNAQVNKDLVLFFIHGVGGSADIWCAQTSYFSDLGYEVVAPDLIGHGFSSTPKEARAYHFKEIAADLEEIFDRYCKKRNIIIGHSYGASFATLLARNRPRRVIKLVLISGGPPTPLAPQPGVFSLPYCMLKCVKPCLKCGFYKGAFHGRRTPVIAKEDSFNIPTYVLQHTMNGQDWPDGDEVFHNWLTCPCLLIYGEKDQLVSLEEELAMEEIIFDCCLKVVKEASHMVMIEAPDEVNQLIANFIMQPGDMYNPQTINNNAAQTEVQRPAAPERSKSRRSLKSAKSRHSLPHHLLSISITG